MKNKKFQFFPSGIIALIVGSALYNQFDINSLEFKQPWLALIYFVTTVVSVLFMFKKVDEKQEE